MKTERLRRIMATVVMLLALAQGLLFLVSWLIVAASPETNIRSLLSNEGIRWFFGTFVDNVATPPLVWIVLLAMAKGAADGSTLLLTWKKGRSAWTYRQTFAFRIVLVQMLLFVLFIAIVAFVPHAPLLSATGSLAHSSFSRSIIPICAGAVTIAAITFGLLTATMGSVEDVVKSLVKGVADAAPLVVLYVFAVELWFSLAYVFRFDF